MDSDRSPQVPTYFNAGTAPPYAPPYSSYPYPPNYGQPQAGGMPVYQQPQVIVVHDQYQPMINQSVVRDMRRRCVIRSVISFGLMIAFMTVFITVMVVVVMP